MNNKMVLLGVLALCAPLGAAPKAKNEGKPEVDTPPEAPVDTQKELLSKA